MMQKFNSNAKIIIGVDHGYGNMKTAHRVFRTGVECMKEEPIVSRNFVKYKEIRLQGRNPLTPFAMYLQ